MKPPPTRTPTVADVLVARYRELRVSGRLDPPDWLTERPSRRELRLLGLAVLLTGLQIILAGAIWTTQAARPPVAAPRPPVRHVKPSVIEPAKPPALNETKPGSGPLIPLLFGSVVQTNNTWTCDSPVHLNLVKVTMTAAMGSDRRNADAIHLRPGCTGEIGRVEVTQSAGDGIKVTEGVHDLTIYSGSVRCLAKGPKMHQDGIQVMGGSNIQMQYLNVDCGRAGGDLVNSNLFIREAGKSVEPPTDVVCDHCTFGGDAAHTVSVQDSIRSGVTDSVLCPAKYSRQMLAVGADAVDPVTTGNRIGACGGAKAGRAVRVVTQHHGG